MTNKNDILLIEPFEQGKSLLKEQGEGPDLVGVGNEDPNKAKKAGNKAPPPPPPPADNDGPDLVGAPKPKGNRFLNKARKGIRKATKDAKKIAKAAKKVKKQIEIKDKISEDDLDEFGLQAKRILDGDFYIVAVTSVWHANHKPELRKDSLGLLIDRLRKNYELFEETYMENNSPKLASFRDKLMDYQKMFEVSIDAPAGILQGDVGTLMAIIDDPNIEYSLGIYEIVEEILNEREAEVESGPDLGDIAVASGDLIVQGFLDSGKFFLKMLHPMGGSESSNGPMDQAEACFESNPYAAIFGLLNGTAYGGFINRPMWSRIALTTIGAPYGAVKIGDRAIKRTFDALGPLERSVTGGSGVISRTAGGLYKNKYGRIAMLFAAAASPAALYYGTGAVIPDDAEDINSIRNTIQKGGDAITGPVGDIITRLAPEFVAKVLDIVMPGSESTISFKKKAEDFELGDSEDPTRAELEYFADLQIDRALALVPTEKEIKNNMYISAVDKIEKMAAKAKANAGKENFIDCYLYTLAGSFLISNLARRGITKAGFEITTALSEKCNAFAARLGEWAKADLRFGKTRQILKLVKDNHLALWLTLKKR